MRKDIGRKKERGGGKPTRQMKQTTRCPYRNLPNGYLPASTPPTLV